LRKIILLSVVILALLGIGLGLWFGLRASVKVVKNDTFRFKDQSRLLVSTVNLKDINLFEPNIDLDLQVMSSLVESRRLQDTSETPSKGS
jgi:hypothetical protein